MYFTSYQIVGNNTSSLNTGSYLNRTEYSLFVDGFITDLWYGFSENDAIEFGVWDRKENLIGWDVINQSKSYNEITSSINDVLNFPVTYSYKELKSDFILYKNEKILVNPIETLSSSFGLESGSYYLTYNFIREMAGTQTDPLIIKEISPSRKELKLVPVNNSNVTYEAFCKKKVLIRDVYSLYIQLLKNCPYSQIYEQIKGQYQSQINTIKSLFFLDSDGAVLDFLRNLYEDLFVYSSVESTLSTIENQVFIRIQGIQSTFNNYLCYNLDSIVDFSDIDKGFQTFTSASIERKFSAIGQYPSQEYVNSKAFVYDFFTKYYYSPIANVLSSTYNEKYFSQLKNAINIGNNRLLPIINTGMMDERIDPVDSLTLLVKLQTELPNDIMVQSQCWITNISLTPYVVSVIVKKVNSKLVYTIGPPNFSIPIPNVSLTNVNKSYTATDLQNIDETDRELTVSRNISELAVDYTNFSNFVIFSSAELRLKIFKNKMINISNYNSSIQLLNDKNNIFLSTNGSSYPFYTQEYDDIQSKLNDIIDSFDGYESYLYRSGNYTYESGSFISSSFITDMDLSASYYDKNNRDSLINNCPEHILTNTQNDDYIIFLSMIGHFFDNIYIYISNLPYEKRVGNNATEEFTRRIVDYMLQTFGWNIDDSLEQTNILNNYLTSDQQENLDSMSAEERLKVIRNRVLINLPQIYKTKGTDEAIRLILSCYGIPSALLSIREFGGVNYADEKAAYTTYERVYMRQWDTSSQNDTYYLHCPTGSHTFLFKFSIDSSEPYVYNRDHTLFGKVSYHTSDITGSGEWGVGFTRVPKHNTGKLFFRIGYQGHETLKMYSPEFPIFDGNIYSVMLRKNYPDAGFEYTSNYDAVPAKYDLVIKRNEFGNQVLNLTSSQICYDTASNIEFGSGGWMNLIGWFTQFNGSGYIGTFDKFQIWYDPISNDNFEDYTNNINAYAFSGSDYKGHESLMFRMHTDYPFDQRQISQGSGSIMGVPDDNWLGIWRNGNPYYAVSSSTKLATIYGNSGSNVDYMVNWGAWAGYQMPVYNTSSCRYVSQSFYPFQFKVIDYPSTWGISKYGPNKFRNEKVHYVSQFIQTRVDDKNRSTFVPGGKASPDSNQIGFFVDPQDFKNRDIIRYFGDYNLMEAIGNPDYQFSSSYQSLNLLRNEYSTARNQYSGSKTLFNELCILYKLYFNRSVFESIKNVIPARANVYVGVLIEPTILERPKYESKPVFTEVNTGSVLYFDTTASHYFHDPNTKLLQLSTSFVDIGYSSLNTSYINLPIRDYPVNYGGNYIKDLPDYYEIGHFAGGNLTAAALQGLVLLPTIAFEFLSPVYAGSSVPFTQTCTGASTFLWDFGDGTTSNQQNPRHIYDLEGDYSVTLQGTSSNNFGSSLTKTIRVNESPISSNFEGVPTSLVLSSEGAASVTFRNLSINATSYEWTFGDGTTSTEVEPTHIYSYASTFTVSLKATKGLYNSTTTKENYITVTNPEAKCEGGKIVGWNGYDMLVDERTINLGNDIGTVTFDFDAYMVPEKFVVTWNGVDVINTGYVGNDDIEFTSRLNQFLVYTYGLPAETITQLSDVSGHEGKGTATFNKTSATPNTITIKVYCPIANFYSYTEPKGWTYTISCPVVT